jgi:AraC-like DNA-binding protein
VDWADLAAELGFADQAHLTRAFTATIGMPPAAYASQAQASGTDVGVSGAVRTPVR